MGLQWLLSMMGQKTPEWPWQSPSYTSMARCHPGPAGAAVHGWEHSIESEHGRMALAKAQLHLHGTLSPWRKLELDQLQGQDAQTRPDLW